MRPAPRVPGANGRIARAVIGNAMRCVSVFGPLAPGALALAALTLGASALAAQSATDRANAAEIRRLRESSNAAIARHDTAGIAAIFAPQVMVLTSNSAVMIGRDVNAQRFAEQFRTRPDVVYRRTPTEVRIFAPWRMASEHGRWTGSWTDTDGKLAIGGSYFAKWRQVDGRWLVESETYVPERCTGGRYCSTEP
jgi:uncharacterized protein (TIGR02246 family)